MLRSSFSVMERVESIPWYMGFARTLWKQRNARVFGNVQQQWSTERIVESIQEEFRMWVLAFAGGSNTLTRD
jgi:hypothetical protein